MKSIKRRWKRVPPARRLRPVAQAEPLGSTGPASHDGIEYPGIDSEVKEMAASGSIASGFPIAPNC